jgi:diaminopimelate epimerase
VHAPGPVAVACAALPGDARVIATARRRRFVKMHGLGNDFAIFDARESPFDPDPATVRRLADRRFGIGCDQLLVLDPARAAGSAAAYRVYNASGEPAEQCGNGARCIAALVAGALSGPTHALALDSPAGVVHARIERDGLVAVQMAVPDFEPADVPFDAPARAPAYEVDANGERVRLAVVSMGNPHAVLRVPAVDDAPVARVGAALERHARFPSGVNVGFMQILSRTHARLRVYERGAGETLACGTGACAAVAVGRDAGVLDEFVAVDLRGGRLMVSWAGAGAPVWMTGPAERVYEGHIDL